MLNSLDPNIPIVYRTPTPAAGIMHNKFLVIDVNSVNSSWIMTGSTNWTNPSNLFNDYNNLIFVQDQALAKAYTMEFEEMWAGSFGSNKIITDFNLKGNEDEFLVLVGPSGCGKSTLLRMIAGLEKIDDGEIFINDIKINELHPSKRQTAMVFQSYALYPHMNVFENMSFGLKIEKRPKEEIQSKVAEAAKILKIEELLDRRPKELSGGQRQRVAIGRAITRNPKIFLFDEPLSNLDAALRAEMRVEISKLHQQIKTNMIYVTHDQVEAMTLADRIVILNQGNIEQVGTPEEIYSDPANIFVAQFIGTPKMNIIEIAEEPVSYTHLTLPTKRIV